MFIVYITATDKDGFKRRETTLSPLAFNASLHVVLGIQAATKTLGGYQSFQFQGCSNISSWTTISQDLAVHNPPHTLLQSSFGFRLHSLFRYADSKRIRYF